MCFKENRHLKEKKMIGDLEKFLKDKNAKLISFQYFPKMFGNITVEIEYKKMLHTFIVDRGEIIHNNKQIRDNSYHIAEQNDSFSTLLEEIQKELFN